MSDELDKVVARQIITSVGASGQPPEYGFQFFSVGLDDVTEILDEEYIQGHIKEGGSSFKAIIGGYGSGKTHFLYTIRELAWQSNFATSLVTLTPEETPFHKLELVYRSIAENLQPPLTPQETFSGSEKGFENFITRWHNAVIERYQLLGIEEQELPEVMEEYAKNNIKGYDSTSFTNAIRQSFLSLLYEKDDDFESIVAWLKGEYYNRAEHSKFGIREKLDKTTAFRRLRSLGQWIRSIGFSGIFILFDEAEQTPSFSSRQMNLHLSNLRQLIDTCQSASFQGFMIFYAIPDEDFLNRSGFVYEALRQRLATNFATFNPSGVKINLETIFGDNPDELKQHLLDVGKKLSTIYSIAYDYEFNQTKLVSILELVATSVGGFFEPGYKRNFVQKIITVYNVMRRDPERSIDEELLSQL